MMKSAAFVAIAMASAMVAPSSLRSASLIFFDAARNEMMLVNAHEGRDLPERVQMRVFDGAAGWRQMESGEGPSARRLTAAAYDSRRNRLVLFGGIGARGYEELKGDTWEWDGRRWTDVTDGAVGTRDHHAMAFDAARGVTVLYGGVSSDRSKPMEQWVFPTDTWTFDGRRWSQAEANGSTPGARVGPAMAYETARERIVLFGGTGRTPDPKGDTWLWDGTRWEHAQHAGGPGPRHGAAMAADPVSGGVLLYGGWNGRPRDEYFNDLWRWDGRTWTEIPVSGERPDARSQAGFSYDPIARRFLLSGGGVVAGGQFQPGEGLWAWDGVRWMRVH